jgi:hypothetical protein
VASLWRDTLAEDLIGGFRFESREYSDGEFLFIKNDDIKGVMSRTSLASRKEVLGNHLYYVRMALMGRLR